jgi:predicted deacylase
MDTSEVGTARASGPGRFEGALTIGATPDGAPIESPVVILRGAADGPVVWMHACVHGNEYCGTYTVHEFLRSLDPAALKGAVIAFPALNITAFRMRQRSSPFEQFNNTDMNRCFPGAPAGGLTEQMAHAVFTQLKRWATHFIDFHTAYTADTRWALYPDPGGEVSRVSRIMADAFGYAHTLPTPARTLATSALMSAGREGIPGFLAEIGGMGSNFDRETVLDGAERLRNIGRAIGLLEGAVTNYGPLTTFSDFHWATAPRGGLFRSHVKCGDTLTKGQRIGTYYDVFGDEDGVAEAPASGIVLAIHTGPIIPQGDVLVHIGLDPREG